MNLYMTTTHTYNCYLYSFRLLIPLFFILFYPNDYFIMSPIMCIDTLRLLDLIVSLNQCLISFPKFCGASRTQCSRDILYKLI